MPSKIIYERFLWFHSQVRRARYPNAATMAHRFEISAKTAQRDIAFMQNRLFAPLVYDFSRRGYAYEDATYELPASWLGADELLALLISFRLASTVPDRGMKARIKTFLNQVLSLYTHEVPISLEGLGEKVSVKNIEYSVTSGKIFQQVLDALLNSRTVKIEYYSPHQDETTSRNILPLHLLSCMGTWHIIAHCALRSELRDFTLSRIRAIEPSAVHIPVPSGTDSIKEYLRWNFGILSSIESIEVCIKFAPDIAPWIQEQVWHANQVVERQPDGSLLLSFSVADFREIKREILKYGSQVEVISPTALRDEVSAEIRKMNNLYT